MLGGAHDAAQDVHGAVCGSAYGRAECCQRSCCRSGCGRNHQYTAATNHRGACSAASRVPASGDNVSACTCDAAGSRSTGAAGTNHNIAASRDDDANTARCHGTATGSFD